MSLETCNTYLALMAMLNDGSDHASDFTITPLEQSLPIEKAVSVFLDQEYSERTYYGHFPLPTKKKINFEFTLVETKGEWREELKKVAKHWFFEDFCSPKISHDLSQENVVNEFIRQIESLTGIPKMYAISMHFDLHPFPFWDGYVFSSDQGLWILQFGWSD